jgi:flagellar basal body rod protein FlgB
MSVDKFQAMLRDRVAVRDVSVPGTVGFGDIEVEHPTRGILFHDGNNRSMEQLVTDQAKNAMMHNLAIELLKKQYGSLKSALMERVS